MTYTDPGDQGASRNAVQHDASQRNVFDDPRIEPRAETQCANVLAFIRRRGSITAREAMTFNCYRLAARVFDLIEMGHPVKKTMESHDGGQHARYHL